jgi:hypothetical protein
MKREVAPYSPPRLILVGIFSAVDWQMNSLEQSSRRGSKRFIRAQRCSGLLITGRADAVLI